MIPRVQRLLYFGRRSNQNGVSTLISSHVPEDIALDIGAHTRADTGNSRLSQKIFTRDYEVSDTSKHMRQLPEETFP